jgi:uncharacterized protein (DUF2384 family)
MALIFSPIGAILVLMVALPPRLTTADREPTEGALTAIKALSRVFKAWRVNGETAATLSGVSERTWTRMRSGAWSGSLNQDQRMRASALIGLYKGLHLYFGDPLADQWVKMPNRGPLFKGRSPLDHMQEGGLPAMMETREYIDAVRGGM